MKIIYFTPFAATMVDAARTHAREFDVAAYDQLYGGYETIPAVNSGEVFYEGEDPYVVNHHGPRHAGHDHHGDYHEPEPVYREPEPVHVERAPVVVDRVPLVVDRAPVVVDRPVHVERAPVHRPHVEADYAHNSYPDETYGNVPHGGFWNEVDHFNEWNPIWDQAEYEERIQTEAELMIALEAIRESLVDLDYEIDRLEDCISHNNEDIEDNYHYI